MDSSISCIIYHVCNKYLYIAIDNKPLQSVQIVIISNMLGN